jgi:hypothetical protein
MCAEYLELFQRLSNNSAKLVRLSRGMPDANGFGAMIPGDELAGIRQEGSRIRSQLERHKNECSACSAERTHLARELV